LAIESSDDAGANWTTAWSVTDRVLERYVDVLTAHAHWDDYYTGDVRTDLQCTTLYVVPESARVIAACGLLGFVFGVVGGDWSVRGFVNGTRVVDFHEPTPSDVNDRFMVLTFGWLLMLGGAEFYALTRRRPPRSPGPAWPEITTPRLLPTARAMAAVIASIPLLLIIGARGGQDGFASATLGMFSLGCMLLFSVVWLVLYLVDVRRFPWWGIQLAVLVPVLEWLLLQRMIGADIDWTLGWIGIWSIAIAGLAVNFGLGLVLARWGQTGGKAQTITSAPGTIHFDHGSPPGHDPGEPRLRLRDSAPGDTGGSSGP
jgi:hypothetical protein